MNRTCMYCGKKPLSPADFTRDHIIPKAVGGSNKQMNLIEACRKCNIRKNNKTPEEFREFIRQSPEALVWKAVDRLKDYSIYTPENDQVKEILTHLWHATVLLQELDVEFYYERVVSPLEIYVAPKDEAA